MARYLPASLIFRMSAISGIIEMNSGGMNDLSESWSRKPHSIDSNKIKKAHQLPSFLRLGPGPWRAFALGVAHGVAWLQRLRWRWRDPGGVHKRHLHLDART